MNKFTNLLTLVLLITSASAVFNRVLQNSNTVLSSTNGVGPNGMGPPGQNQPPLLVSIVVPDFTSGTDYLGTDEEIAQFELPTQVVFADAKNRIFYNDKDLCLDVFGIKLDRSMIFDMQNNGPEQMEDMVKDLIFSPVMGQLEGFGSLFDFTDVTITWKLAAYGQIVTDLMPTIAHSSIRNATDLLTTPIQGWGCNVVEAITKLGGVFTTGDLDSEVSAFLNAANATVLEQIRTMTAMPTMEDLNKQMLPVEKSLRILQQQQQQPPEKPKQNNDVKFRNPNHKLNDILQEIKMMQPDMTIVEDGTALTTKETALFSGMTQPNTTNINLLATSLLAATTVETVVGQFCFVLSYEFLNGNGLKQVGFFKFAVRERYTYDDTTTLNLGILTVADSEEETAPQDFTSYKLGVSSITVDTNLMFGTMKEFKMMTQQTAELTQEAPYFTSGFSLINGVQPVVLVACNKFDSAYTLQALAYPLTSSDTDAANCLNYGKPVNPLEKLGNFNALSVDQKQLIRQSLKSKLKEKQQEHKDNSQGFDPTTPRLPKSFCGQDGNCNSGGVCVQEDSKHGRCQCEAGFVAPVCQTQDDIDAQNLFMDSQLTAMDSLTGDALTESIQVLQSTFVSGSPSKAFMKTARAQLKAKATAGAVSGNSAAALAFVNSFSQMASSSITDTNSYTDAEFAEQLQDIRQSVASISAEYTTSVLDTDNAIASLSSDSTSFSSALIADSSNVYVDDSSSSSDGTRILQDATTYQTFEGEPVIDNEVTISASSVLIPSTNVAVVESYTVHLSTQSDDNWADLLTTDTPAIQVTEQLSTLITELSFENDGAAVVVSDSVNTIQLTLGLKSALPDDGSMMFEGVMVNADGTLTKTGITVSTYTSTSVTLVIPGSGAFAACSVEVTTDDSTDNTTDDSSDDSTDDSTDNTTDDSTEESTDNQTDNSSSINALQFMVIFLLSIII